jgi:hypothetical protein
MCGITTMNPVYVINDFFYKEFVHSNQISPEYTLLPMNEIHSYIF